MFPSSQELAGQSGGDLEERLRGLILSNANANQIHGAGTPSASPQLPPHMLGSTPAEQLEYLTTAASRTSPQDTSSPSQPSPTSKKRLNQAQRRQMNAQLSIPIDPRPPQGVQAGRGTSSYGPQGHSPWTHSNWNGPSPQFHQQSRYQQHQQYTPRFPNQGPGSPYSPRMSYPQPSPQSPLHPYQPGPGQPFLPRHSPGQPYQPSSYARPPSQNRQLYQPSTHNSQGRGRPIGHNPDEILIQSTYLETLLQGSINDIGIGPEEEAQKEAFRAVVERICQQAISQYEQEELGNAMFDPLSVEVQCFGSMKSGFATKASDMDLALVTPKSHPPPDSPDSAIPRLLERKLLDLGFGARLLTKTRVPIIKLCEKPTGKLLRDLLEARVKWENGFTGEGDEEDEEQNDAIVSAEREKLPKKKRPESGSSLVVRDDSQKVKLDLYEERLVALKQKESQSLGDYYNTAKRLLRRLGGRDISASSPELNDTESKILNDVCKFFVSGLASETLSGRLCTYQSIAPLFDLSLPIAQRSLHGVWTQIEGERLALAWDTRPLTEPFDKHEFECTNMVEAWRALQDNHGPLTEPLVYNRQLFTASEKLKKIASLQLVYLEQIQHEDPLFYYARAQRIMDDLKNRDEPNASDSITPIIIAHYIAGIHNHQIREAIQASSHHGATLQKVALHHRALQLVMDYNHALQVGMYDKVGREDVEKYVTLLRTQNFYDPTMPVIEDSLVAKIRSLPDPTTISPNKPRDKYKDHLEFPKTDIGIQCDINFSAHLAIHNTQLLHCYSLTDSRVKTVILFVKHWAKVRGINTPYRGTLSSYGYVLMVLHYLVNIAQPFVCPNLQTVKKDPSSYLSPSEIEARSVCNGRDVRFWRNELEIKNLAERKMLNHNHDSVGTLLRGFFEYFAQNGQMSTVQDRGFDWGREVLSIRTMGGILTKQEKGWVGAKTVVETTTIAAPSTPSSGKSLEPNKSQDGTFGEGATETRPPKISMKTMEETKEVRHRYLFAIEDPFELDHNVARTVTHNGIVSIRDEFRRAWRIIKSIGKPYENRDEGLLDLVKSDGDGKSGLQELLDLIHGSVRSVDELKGSQKCS